MINATGTKSAIDLAVKTIIDRTHAWTTDQDANLPAHMPIVSHWIDRPISQGLRKVRALDI